MVLTLPALVIPPIAPGPDPAIKLPAEQAPKSMWDRLVAALTLKPKTGA